MEKEATLVRRTEREETFWRHHYMAYVRAGSLTRKLPVEILELEGLAKTYWWDMDKNSLNLEFSQSVNEIDLVKRFKLLGVALASSHSYEDHWRYIGKGIFNGVECSITIDTTSAPEGCIIEEYEETVKKIRAICPKTGKEI